MRTNIIFLTLFLASRLPHTAGFMAQTQTLQRSLSTIKRCQGSTNNPKQLSHKGIISTSSMDIVLSQFPSPPKELSKSIIIDASAQFFLLRTALAPLSTVQSFKLLPVSFILSTIYLCLAPKFGNDGLKFGNNINKHSPLKDKRLDPIKLLAAALYSAFTFGSIYGIVLTIRDNIIFNALLEKPLTPIKTRPLLLKTGKTIERLFPIYLSGLSLRAIFPKRILKSAIAKTGIDFRFEMKLISAAPLSSMPADVLLINLMLIFARKFAFYLALDAWAKHKKTSHRDSE